MTTLVQRVWNGLREPSAKAAFADVEQRSEYALRVLTRAAQKFREYEELHKRAGDHNQAAAAASLLEDCERAIERLTA